MEKKCFVIMPFSKTTERHDELYWNEFFTSIKQIMQKCNYCCMRSETGPYKLFSNIVDNLENSDVVIAVLTDYNSNVWYELGIRHTLKKGTIMLLQEGQKAPFDVADFGMIFYKDSVGLERYLEEEITKYLSKLNNNICDSPVISSLNNKANNGLDKKVEELQQLIWKLIEEIPRNKNIQNKNRIQQNKILWVDDYPINNESVINLLEDRNVQVDIAISTKQGLEFFKKQNYDIIITDMGRGNESDAGLKLLRYLASLGCKAPIIVYASQRAINTYGKDAYKLGAYAVTNGIGNIISLISDILVL